MKRMIFASVFVLLWCFPATAQTTTGATQNSLVSKVDFPMTDGVVQAYQGHLVKVLIDGSAVLVYNENLAQSFKLDKAAFQGSLSQALSYGAMTAGISFSESEAFITTRTLTSNNGSIPSYAYSVDLKTGKLTKLIGIGEEFPVLGGLWKTPANPEGKGIVESTGDTVAKLNGKYYVYLRLKRPEKNEYTSGVFELTFSGEQKAIRVISSIALGETVNPYGTPIAGKDNVLYYLTKEIENGSAAGKFFYVKGWSPSLGTKEVYSHRRTQSGDYCWLYSSIPAAANCGTPTDAKLLILDQGQVTREIHLSGNSLPFKQASPAKMNGLGVFIYSEAYTPAPWPNIGLIANGQALALTNPGDSYQGNAWIGAYSFECKVLAATATTTYMFEPVVIQGVKHAEKVKLPGCFPGVTRENLQVFANGVRIYPDYAELFDPPTTRELSFKPPATVGGKTEFTVAIRHASAPQGWMRSVNGVTLDLPFAFPTASITSATPMPLKPDGEIAVAWQANLSGRVTAITPPPQGIVVYPSFNATQGVFRFKPSKAGQHTLEITLENGSKIGADFEVKFTLPQITSVQNAAKDTAGLCPGAHATAFGSFASGDEIWAEYKPLLPTFFSTNQVNVIIPSDFGPGLIKVQAVRSGQIASEVEVQLLPACPAAFEDNGNAILTDEHGVRAMDERNAPIPGKIYTLWANGCGPTDPFVPTGELAPSSPLSQVTSPVSLNIGGNEAQLLFAGLAPGLLQVCQINFVMPGVPHGSNPQPVALRIKVGEQESTSSTLTY